jgi:2-polyprenyl-3-methyl-5-hydroxy-6-metoxy-1,4-benzoquinol methylase
MTGDIALQHRAEVRQRERFAFGKNWRLFLHTLDDDRIRRAEKSLQDFLGQERLDGLSFLDIGSGSGLFSLAARRLGALVHSFDYDTDSVGCTQELRHRYFADDPNWIVEQGSALDTEYLGRLPQFDIVYSWGVLHHTGQMWRALDLVKGLVKPGGRLFIAIYNELGAITDEWRRIKEKYNALPPLLRMPYAAKVLAREEWPQLMQYWKRGDPLGYIRRWRDYRKTSARGMDFWRDQVDWIGGLPYECATLDQILDFYMADGFEPVKTVHREAGYGCNEFVFRRVAERGVCIDRRLEHSAWLARRAGHRLAEVEVREGQSYARLMEPVQQRDGEELSVFVGNDLGPRARAEAMCADGVEAVSWDGIITGGALCIVSSRRRRLEPPFGHARDHMWFANVPDLQDQCDSVEGLKSDITPFLGGKQLPMARAVMDEIAEHGGGRYSHWLACLYFSTVDGSDPNQSAAPLEILYRDPA